MLRENPDDKEAAIGLARTHNWSGRHFLAAREYEAAARKWPTDETIKNDLARAQRWAGTDNLALGTLAGITESKAATLRRQARIDSLRGLRFSATTSYDTDRLRIHSETLAFRYPFDATRLLQTSLRLAQLEQRGQHADGKELLVSYGDRFGAFDAPRGLIWPTISAGIRDYEGWQTFAWRAGAKWLPADLWRIDLDAGNEVIENIPSVRNKVTFTSLGAGTEVRIHPRITAAASLGLGRFDDGNVRNRMRARIEGVVLTQPRITLGWEGFRFANSKPDIVRGYYNPESYIENKLISSIETTRWDWNFMAKGRFRTAQRRTFWNRPWNLFLGTSCLALHPGFGKPTPVCWPLRFRLQFQFSIWQGIRAQLRRHRLDDHLLTRHPVQLPFSGQVAPHPGHQLHRLKRLDNIIGNARVERPDYVAFLGSARQHDHRHITPLGLGADMGIQLVAIRIRQHQIKQHQTGWRYFVYYSLRLATIRGHNHLKSFTRKHKIQQKTDAFVIFHNNNNGFRMILLCRHCNSTLRLKYEYLACGGRPPSRVLSARWRER
jgi:hypothetical protein